MTIEDVLIEHVVTADYAKLPRDAVERARLAILDTLGVALAGTVRAELFPLVEYVVEAGGRAESAVVARRVKVPTAQAALANGALARAWDFDDIYKHSPAAGHASVNIVPAALAVAERIGTVTGRELLVAVTLAHDVFCRLSLAVRTEANATGRYCMFAIFAPAVVAGRLLGLDRKTMAHALGIAYAQAAGEMQKYQTSALTIAAQNGFISMSGVLSALLAERGISGAHDVFTGRHGFFKVFEPDNDVEALTRDLGRTYPAVELSIKAYPCCSCSHTAIEAARHLAVAHDLQPEEILAIQVGVNRAAYDSTCVPQSLKWNPVITSHRQFSLPYVVAAVIVEGRISIETFLPQHDRDRRIWKLLAVTRAEIDPEIEAEYGHLAEGPARVIVRTQSGAEYSHVTSYERGHARNPMVWSDVTEKFADCWRAAKLPDDGTADGIVKTIAHLEQFDDLKELWASLGSLAPTQCKNSTR